MGNLCSRGPKTQVLIEREIDGLGAAYPQIMACCLISGDGKAIVAQMSSRVINSTGETQEIDYAAMLPLINAYRKSATAFGQTLQHYDTRSIHIRAQQTLFSSYILGKNILNIFSEINPVEDSAAIEIIDTKILDGHVDQFATKLRQILEQAAAAS